MKHTRRIGALVLGCALLCSGCTDAGIVRVRQHAGLPSGISGIPAPMADALDQVVTRQLYVPDQEHERLLAQSISLTQSLNASTASQVLQAVLIAAQGSGQIALYGSSPVQLSSGVCTVNLSPAARALSPQELYALGAAMAASLSEESVAPQRMVLLVADQAPAMDVAGNLPAGAFPADTEVPLGERWAKVEDQRAPLGENPAGTPLRAEAALYYPRSDGTGIFPSVKLLDFAGQSPQQLTAGLLQALSLGISPDGAPSLQVLGDLLAGDVRASDRIEGGRMVSLPLVPDWESRCEAAGVDPACLAAAVAMTIINFVPSVPVVALTVDDVPLQSLTFTTGSVRFDDGVITRSVLLPRVVDPAEIVLADAEGLRPVQRSVPPAEGKNPRRLFGLLLQGATAAEKVAGIRSPLPGGLHVDTDVIGMEKQGDTLLIHLSQAFAGALRAMQPTEERSAAYAMVNTLAKATDTRRVLFFFGGTQVQTLAGAVDWSGAFLYRPALQEEEGNG